MDHNRVEVLVELLQQAPSITQAVWAYLLVHLCLPSLSSGIKAPGGVCGDCRSVAFGSEASGRAPCERYVCCCMSRRLVDRMPAVWPLHSSRS